ncbi:hypothetical protein ACNI3K_08905 [Demequina sp. SO4-13]|uniref:ApeA N-terminal domain 1-containing protein n=1 Tax=Demequina sp. SO4-13 TaxID=3401027 RepID=UPI003AF8763C
MASGNKLEVAQPRLGWLVDGLDTEDRAVMLRDTGTAIELTVPTRGYQEPDGGHGDWFAADSFITRIPAPPPRLEMPSVLAFEDGDGAVALAGCQARSGSSGTHGGHGVIRADYAIFGVGSLAYAQVNGMRTELPFLPQWMGRRNVHAEWTQQVTNRAGSLEVNVEPPELIRVARNLNLALRRGYRAKVSPVPGRTLFEDIVEVETRVSRPRAWDEHLAVHRAIADLLALAAWKPAGHHRMSAVIDRDPQRTMTGAGRGAPWREVATHRLPRQPYVEERQHFLFGFEDIGVAGLRRWLGMRRFFARGLDPVIALAQRPEQDLQTVVMQAGVAIEALGYLICRHEHEGAHLNRWDQMPYAEAARHLVGECTSQPVPDADEWVQASSDAYRAVKHADNDMPDLEIVLTSALDSLSVVRYWVATRLGCSAERLEHARRLDPLRR